ncbi:conserved hypothetical protein [Pediculus humanus corporis]|uniref:Monocarboxylate transporter n=1 Tax=Pediculus humanus subsp. corporis TaxID=121224 RepID=E0VYS4_PEDHC|nr:uncharacterized protein Phum_PHUM518030 [Pediculus humanus corporis]EEB18530.1 conserved hypothetical protein [Pediculus humanus corporis]
MLNRSRSWPIQSVITLDPRGIIYAKVHPSFEKYNNNNNNNAIITRRNENESCAVGKPDIVIETDERVPVFIKPDIFVTLEPRQDSISNSHGCDESKQITFVDHYQVLDSVSDDEEKDGGYIVSVPSVECTNRKIIPSRINDDCAFNKKNDIGAFLESSNASNHNNNNNKNIRVIVDVENTNSYYNRKCKICRGKEIIRKKSNYKFDKPDKRYDDKKNVVRSESEREKHFLTAYQIDLLRKKNNKRSQRKIRHDDVDRRGTGEKNRFFFKNKKIDKKSKAASDCGESIASNDTKITEFDEKCVTSTSGGIARRYYRSDNNYNTGRRSSYRFIRSYSLGHEKTDEKLRGTFKKFSLPTPVIQLKDGNDNNNDDNSPEDKENSALRNLNLDKRKVTTLTRHYYPENNWGYVIVTCSVMVHILCHGLQLSAGVIMIPAASKFTTDPVHTVVSSCQISFNFFFLFVFFFFFL